MKILVAEDNKREGGLLQKALVAQQYLVELALDGCSGWELVEAFNYDLILLNEKLPKLDGISFCKQLRAKGNRTPVVLLTASENRTNTIAGLDAGADDYIAKPYDTDELLARIRAILRRGSTTSSPILEWNSLRLDPNKCEVTYHEKPLHVTAKEYMMLELFLRNTQRIFSQNALIDRLWASEECPNENTVRAHMKSLRRKLKKAGTAADFIETIYGLGYRLKLTDSELRNDNTTDQRTENDDSAHRQTPSDLEGIWIRSKDKYYSRITVLEQAIASLRAGELDADLEQKAQREAHTLRGSLGSFGLIEAERLSCKIEQMLQTRAGFRHTYIENLAGLVEALKQELAKPFVVDFSATQSRVIKQNCRLLIIDDDEELALAVRSEAVAWGMQADIVNTVSQANEVIRQFQPDVILLDLGFPGSKEGGLDLLEELASTRSPIPVLVLTGADQLADRVEVARLGGRAFLQKPILPTQVLEQIVHVLHQSGPPDAKVLIVDDDPQLLAYLKVLLEPWGLQIILLENPQQFWSVLEQTAPNLLILDIEMPDFNGIDLCQVIRNEPRWSDLPVLFLSIHRDEETIYQAFTSGADDFVHKPIVGAELVARILNRLERTQSRRKMSQRKA
jgi:DNA-binding response OmpR family regulator